MLLLHKSAKFEQQTLMIMKHYVEGDSISVNYCGEDLSASTTGKVVFIDKLVKELVLFTARAA